MTLMQSDFPSESNRQSAPRDRRGGLAGIVLLLVSLFGLLAAIEASGQGQYSFRNWQSEDGLPVNLVRSIVQSADGQLWIATAEGIARFDGIEFERIELGEDFRYPTGGGLRLFATPDGAVWFSGPNGGLLRIVNGATSVIWPDGGGVPVTQVVDFPGRGVLIRRGKETWRHSDLKISLIDSVSGFFVPDNLLDRLSNLFVGTAIAQQGLEIIFFE